MDNKVKARFDEQPQQVNGQHSREIILADNLPPKAHPYDYLLVLRRYKWLILGIIILGMGVTIAYLMIMPQTYTATATLLPPDKSEGVNFNAILQKNMGLDLAGLSQNSSAEIFSEILRSRSLADSLVTRFNMTRHFGLPPEMRQRAVFLLQLGIDISADRHGVVRLAYNSQTGFFPTPEEQAEAARKSAQICNGMIQVLDYMNRVKIVKGTRRMREYLGEMRALKRVERDSIQRALLAFQTRNKAVALDQQIEASVTALAESQSQIAKKEVELSAVENELGPENRNVQMLRSQLSELRRQKAAIESRGVGGASLGIDMRNLPDLARTYANLKLDLEVATEIYSYLDLQYHQQQVDEARDMPTVSVLDSAQVPDGRSAPRRGLAIGIVFPMLVIGALLLVFMIDSYRRILSADRAHRADEMAAYGRARQLEGKESV